MHEFPRENTFLSVSVYGVCSSRIRIIFISKSMLVGIGRLWLESGIT